MLDAMRPLRLPLLLVAFVFAACAGDDGDSAAPTTTTTTGPATTGELVDPPPPAATEIDCEAMADPHFELAFSTQFLAQLISNAQFEAIADGTIDVDFDDIREAVAALRPLDDVEDNIVGSVDDSLDRIDRAAALAAAAADSDDPESTAAFAELQTVIGDSAALVAAMGPINYAFGEAGCF